VRRYLIAVAALLALAVIHMIVSAGSTLEANSAASQPVSRAQPTATASTRRRTATQALANIVTRLECRWRRYADDAIGTDPDCAPGALNPAVPGHVEQTICSRAWAATAESAQPSSTFKDELLIDYQLPGNPATYVVAHVVPVEDGGSATGALNLYPLPLDGYGGQMTRTMVADQLHDDICSHKITTAHAAQALEGDWLPAGLPDDD
jgi:hypothetical protein